MARGGCGDHESIPEQGRLFCTQHFDSGDRRVNVLFCLGLSIFRFPLIKLAMWQLVPRLHLRTLPSSKDNGLTSVKGDDLEMRTRLLLQQLADL